MGELLYGEISARFWREMQKSAERRNIPFGITPEEAWDKFLRQGRRCAMTGKFVEFYSGGYRGSASPDRIDSDQPYVADNFQWTLADINIMKKGHSVRYFKELCRMVTFPENLAMNDTLREQIASIIENGSPLNPEDCEELAEEIIQLLVRRGYLEKGEE
jgi:hypothetical protein